MTTSTIPDKDGHIYIASDAETDLGAPPKIPPSIRQSVEQNLEDLQPEKRSFSC